MRRSVIVGLGWLIVPSAWVRTALGLYIAKPDASYTFSRYHSENGAGSKAYFISMVSQRWRDDTEVGPAAWIHKLIIDVPQLLFSDSPETAVLYIDGGDNDDLRPEEPEQFRQYWEAYGACDDRAGEQ